MSPLLLSKSVNTLVMTRLQRDPETRKHTTDMTCTQGYNARVTLVDRQLVTSPLPSHPTHDFQHAETHVHVAKQTLNKTSAVPDLPTKLIIAESLNGMSFEATSKLNCQIRSLNKMARYSRITQPPCKP